MIQRCGLKALGKHHSGIDDTINIARCVIQCLKLGFKFHQGHVNVLPYANTGFCSVDDFPLKKPENSEPEKYSIVDVAAINSELLLNLPKTEKQQWQTAKKQSRKKKATEYNDSTHEQELDEKTTLIHDNLFEEEKIPQVPEQNIVKLKGSESPKMSRSETQNDQQEEVDEYKLEETKTLPSIIDHPFYFTEVWKTFYDDYYEYDCVSERWNIAEGSRSIKLDFEFIEDGKEILLINYRDRKCGDQH